MAPEFMEHKIFSPKSDIYSFGILLHEVFSHDLKIENASNLNPFGELQGV